MSVYSEGLARWDRVKKWRRTETYASLCEEHERDCQRLLDIAQQYLADIPALDATIKAAAVKTECAVRSDMHRGFYCPSPIRDLVIGNIHRGRILKRVTASSKITHRYGLDSSGILLYTEYFHNGKLCGTEYIISQDDRIYGITVSEASKLTAISEECYRDQRLERYTYANINSVDGDPLCWNLRTEEYRYDKLGLKSCELADYNVPLKLRTKYYYEFEREKGYLSSYIAIDRSIEGYETEYQEPQVYLISEERKA